MKALSIRQPWASLILYGLKPVENREWSTNHRGPTAIHASQQMDEEAMQRIIRGRHPVTGKPALFPEMLFPTGGIIGTADLTACVTRHSSDYFTGRFGFVFENPQHIPLVRYRGQLGLFDIPDTLLPALSGQSAFL